MTEGGTRSAPALLARPGETCWRRERAHRAAFVIDGAAFFEAARAAMLHAERSILILAWELHTRVDLVPRQPDEPPVDDGWPTRLGELLRALVEARPELEVHILLWDFAMIYALERELIPIFRLPWRAHPHIRLHMDSSHPPGASQHQKIVTVDGKMAFSGGLDLTANRWDTPEHRADDPRRTNPAGEAYGPFHDLMMAVDGPAARALDELARERWRRATGETLDVPPETDADPWPARLAADLSEVDVAISRTEPAYDGRPEVREVEALFLESIAAAERFVYIEQQYFTSTRIGDAIVESLARPQGPEFVIVLPYKTTGWLEETTMGVGRVRLQHRLQEADMHGRLRVYQVVVPDAGPEAVKLHAKVMVVDDRLARIGSANLSNRSMGLDSECDLTVEAAGDKALAAEIARLRNRLLAEHLGTMPEAVAEAVTREGSLIAAIESLRAPEGANARTMIPLVHEVPEVLERLVPDMRLLDPERPIEPERLAQRLLPAGERDETGEEVAADAPAAGGDAVSAAPPVPARRVRARALARLAGGLLAVTALAGLWAATPLHQLADMQALLAWMEGLRGSPLAPLYGVAGFVLGGFAALPVTVMISLAGVLFGPAVGLAVAFAGCLLSATTMFYVGRLLGRDTVRRLAAPYVNRISRRIGQHSVLAVALLRMVPVAPFSLINLAAGAIRLRLREFLLGTALGMGPGMVALVVFGDRLGATLRDPSAGSLAALAGAVLLVMAIAFGADAWAARRRRRRAVGAAAGEGDRESA